jgi:hypothetical protein
VCVSNPDYRISVAAGVDRGTREVKTARSTTLREREDVNRTREAEHLDEIQGVVTNILKF